MVKALENAGFQRTHSFWSNGDFMQVHFDGKRNHPLIYRENGLIIIPLRDKEEVKASWQRRGKSLPEMEEMWSEMEDFVQGHPEHIYMIHIDDPERREEELKELSAKLGTYLIVDFDEKVGQGH